MVDIFEPEKRSDLMSRIRGKNTKPELLVFKYLRTHKIYFRKHYRSREGIVLDLALPRKRKAVMVDGDFWHGRTIDKVIERRGKDDFWVKKLQRNIARDSEQRNLLSEAGWKILTVWESDLMRMKTQLKTLESIEAFLIDDDIEITDLPYCGFWQMNQNSYYI